MARTIQTIYDSLIAEKQNQSNLNSLSGEGSANWAAQLLADLNSQSQVAIWRLMLWLVAFAAWTIESLMDNFKAEISALADSTIAGSEAWIVNQMKLFEVNNNTLYVTPNRTAVYASSNPANRIIVFCSVAREFGSAVIKVAAVDNNGFPKVINGSELTQIKAYVNDIQLVGTRTLVVSRISDYLLINGYIDFDVLGDINTITNTFFGTLSNLIAATTFGGKVNLAAINAQLMAIPGVKGMNIYYTAEVNGLGPSGPITDPFYTPWAGYCAYSDDGNYTINLV